MRRPDATTVSVLVGMGAGLVGYMLLRPNSDIFPGILVFIIPMALFIVFAASRESDNPYDNGQGGPR